MSGQKCLWSEMSGNDLSDAAMLTGYIEAC